MISHDQTKSFIASDNGTSHQEVAQTVGEKIVSLDEMAFLCRTFRKEDRTIAHCHGCFDLMHPGHIKYFEAAKALADVLIVTLTPDHYVDKGPNRPAFSQELRAYSIASLACVDYVAVNHWPTAMETLRLLRPNYYVKGQEFEGLQDATGKLQREAEVIREIGAKMHFTQEIVFSSTALLNKNFNMEDRRESQNPRCPTPDPWQSQVAWPAENDFMTAIRSRYTLKNAIDHLEKLQELRVCVIGDVIIDEYRYCDPLGTASKSSIVAHRHSHHEAHAGGVCAIANHIAEVCEKVHLVSLLGADDSRETFIREHLNSSIEARFFFREDGPSNIKTRYLSRRDQQKLFEINRLPTSFIDTETEEQIVGYFEAELSQYDLVLVADYGHGFLTERLIQALGQCKACLAVNTQTNSANTGFNMITRYPRADFVCLDEIETRLATQERDGDIEEITRSLSRQLNSSTFVVTLGARGSVALPADGEILRAPPVVETSCLDATGAGDAFFSYTAPAVAAGLPLDFISLIGNAAGALAVQIIGNQRPVRKAELIAFLEASLRTPMRDKSLLLTDNVQKNLPTAEPEETSAKTALAKGYYCDLARHTQAIIITDRQGRELSFVEGISLVDQSIEVLAEARHKLMLIGNGASAAIASHMAADFSKNGGIRAITFNDSPLMTAVSNDISYQEVFEMPIRLFADSGDILLAISSSGRSENILRGSRAAREAGCVLITLSGFQPDNPLRSLGDLNFYVPCESYGLVEVIHHSICHCLLDCHLQKESVTEQ